MAHLIFAHSPSGEKFAVQANEDGEIVGANGPLHYSEFPAILAGDWDADPELTEWFQQNDYSEAGYSDVTDAIRAEIANG
jgi:hypothetical protein